MADTKGKRFQGIVVDVEHELGTLPDGRQYEFEIVHHPGGAAAVAVDTQQRVCLLRQYRYVLDEWLWELPAGKLDGEDPKWAAQRELAEETGVHAARWNSLGHVVSSPGVFTERVHLFLASDLTQGVPDIDEHEVLEVHWVPLAEAVGWALDGTINDGKTVVGLLRAQHWRSSGTY